MQVEKGKGAVMSYQRERDQFISQASKEGLDLATITKLAVCAGEEEVKTMHKLTTQRQVRAAFWQGWTPELEAAAGIKREMKTQNDYPAAVRMEWVDFVDMLARDGVISEELAARVTL